MWALNSSPQTGLAAPHAVRLLRISETLNLPLPEKTKQCDAQLVPWKHFDRPEALHLWASVRRACRLGFLEMIQGALARPAARCRVQVRCQHSECTAHVS